MKQIVKATISEKQAVKEVRQRLARRVNEIRVTCDKVNDWLDKNENALNTLLDTRKYEKAIALLQKASADVGEALYLGDEIEGYLYDAMDESIQEDELQRCPTCGTLREDME